MESLEALNVRLDNLGSQARRLTSTARALITLFASEATRLSREDEVSRLGALRSFIREQINNVKWIEDSASYGHNQADIVLSLGKLATIGIGLASKNKRLSSFTNSLLESTTTKEPPVGKVFICIGPKGLPADVEVVSISRIARESNRQESDVIQELRERGYLLFSEEKFSALIDKLVEDIRKGRLSLPISREKLSEIMVLNQLNLKLKKVE